MYLPKITREDDYSRVDDGCSRMSVHSLTLSEIPVDRESKTQKVVPESVSPRLCAVEETRRDRCKDWLSLTLLIHY